MVLNLSQNCSWDGAVWVHFETSFVAVFVVADFGANLEVAPASKATSSLHKVVVAAVVEQFAVVVLMQCNFQEAVAVVVSLFERPPRFGKHFAGLASSADVERFEIVADANSAVASTELECYFGVMNDGSR